MRHGNDAASLRTDQRGAVMLTGMFMAFFLVGALWFVIGIGEAVVFRDRMQEAADSAAFTSAVLQAKGMNFIAACNIIMLLMVIVHLVLGMIHDMLLATCLATLVGCVPYIGAMRGYHAYARTMKPVLSGIATAERVAAYGYPWLGTVKGFQTGARYGNQGRVGDVNVLVIGASNVPGLVGKGLPVGAENFDYLCAKATDKVIDFGTEIAGKAIPGFVRFIINLPFGPSMKKIRKVFSAIVGKVIEFRYCNALFGGDDDPALQAASKYLKKGQDKLKKEKVQGAETVGQNLGTGNGSWSPIIDPGFDKGWGNEGPLVAGAANGSDAMQVYAINIDPKLRDTSERRVAVPSELKRRRWAVDTDVRATYVTQAEFFFDCADSWDGDECNGGDTLGFADNNASFAIKWRARLRHVELPNFGQMLASFALGQITSSPGYEAIREKLTNNGLFEKLTNGPLSALGVSVLRDWVDAQIAALEDQAGGMIGDAASTPTELQGAYH